MLTLSHLRSHSRFATLILAGSIAACLGHSAVEAANGTWLNTGATNGLWSTPSNWASGIVPGATTGTTNTDTAAFESPEGVFGTSVNPIVIDPDRIIRFVNFQGGAGNYVLGTTGGNALRLPLGGAIQITNTLTSTNAVVNINAPILLQSAGSLNNHSANGSGPGAGTLNFGGTISGVSGTQNLSLGGSNTNANTISGVIGNGTATAVTLIKSGPGTWVLSETNTFTGIAVILDGTLSVNSIANGGVPSAAGAGSGFNLGSSGGTNNAKLQFTGASGGSSNRTINLNPNGLLGGGGTIENTVPGQTLTISGSVSTGTIQTLNTTLGLAGAGDGVLSGTLSNNAGRMSVLKSGAGTWTLSGSSNAFSGDVTVSGGVLQLGSTRALGHGGGQTTATGTTTVNSGFTLDLNGRTGINEPIILNGTGIGGNGALVNNSVTPASIANGIAGLAVPATGIGSGLSAAPSVSISGTGTGATATASLGLTTASITSVSGGTGWVTGDTVLFTGGTGSGAIGTVTASGGAITGITVTNAGRGYSAPTNISRLTGNGNTTGVTLTGNATNFTVGGLTVTNAGSGYTGTPSVTIGGSPAPTVTPTRSSVNLATTSSIGGSGDTTIAAVVSGAGLTKVGAGTLTLTGANTYTGNTAVTGGKLTLSGSGSFASSPDLAVASGATLDVSGVTGGANWDGTRFAVVNGQTLHGTGTVLGALNVSAGGTIAAGNSIGTLAIGSLSLTSATSHFALEIDLGLTPAADLLNVTGGIALGGATLDLTLFNFTPGSLPQTFLFGTNDLLDPVSGTFGTITGVPLGYDATIDYAYAGTDDLGRVGDGNDLAITLYDLSAVPEPATAAWGLAVGLVAITRRRRTR